MILVIPFTGPSEYLDELSARLLKLGGLGGHRLLVPAPQNLLSGAESFVTALRSQFVAADVVPVNTPGAPLIRLFRDGLMAGVRVKPSMQEIPSAPVLWLEPGFLPNKTDWADGLQSAFFNSGGGLRILASWRKRPDITVGNGNARHLIPGGWEPVGPAVFPPGWISSQEMIRRINDASSPWRDYLQFTFGDSRTESPFLSDAPESLIVEFKPTLKAETKPKPTPVGEPSDVVIPTEIPSDAPAEAVQAPVRRVAAGRSFASAPTTPTV